MTGRFFRACFAIGLSLIMIFLAICPGMADPVHILASSWVPFFDQYVSDSGEKPEVKYEYETVMNLITTKLLTKDNTFDLFVFDAFKGLYHIKRTGYYTPLSDSTILSDACEKMYPAYQTLLKNDNDEIICWLMYSQPVVMDENEDFLESMGLKTPETFEELIDTCLALDASDNFSWEDYSLLGGFYSFDKHSMMECYMDYYLMCGQQLNHAINFENEDFIKNVVKIRDCVPDEDPSQGEDRVFDIPVAYEAPNAEMLNIPSVMRDTSNAVETLATVAVVNPYSEHKEEAIAFLEWCASQRGSNRYFCDSTMNEAVINKDMVERKAQAEEKLAKLKTLDLTEEVATEIEDTELQIELAERYKYYISEEDIAWYKNNFADRLFISEGRPIIYDETLDLYVEQFLSGQSTAEQFAHDCQNHIDMVYNELQ